MLFPIFRQPAREDIDQLVKLRILMQQEVNGIRDADISKCTLESIHQYFIESLADGSYISTVADLNGKIVSTNGLVFYRKPPSLTGGKGIIGYVTNVYTVPEWRKRGIARELMKILIEQAKAKGLDKLHLGSTDAGKKVYKSVGFKCVDYTTLELKLAA